MKKKYYTLDEANAVLPQVRRMVAKIKHAEETQQEKQKAFSEIMLAIAQNGGDIPLSYISQLEKALGRAGLMMQKLMEELQTKFNCEVKGIQPMLVDFYSQRDGREVYLCWKEGEDEVSHWHDLDSGFAGRRPI